MKFTSWMSGLLLASTRLTPVLSAALPLKHINSGPMPPELVCMTNSSPEVTIDWTNLTVPLNWEELSGETITITINRVPALNDPANAKDLFINPGGPGGSAVGSVGALGLDAESNSLRQHYNLIGVDPRGVGTSTPIKCYDAHANERLFSQIPRTQDEFVRTAERNQAIGESCSGSELLHHVDTASVARDLDVVRTALGDERINFLAFSYGTMIATQFAELFPERVGRFVLDGIVDHSGSETYMLLNNALAAESAFVRFADWCKSSTDCALYGQDVATIFDTIVNEAEDKPIPALRCNGTDCRRDVTNYEIFGSALISINKRKDWPGLGVAIAEAASGDATAMSSRLDGEPTDFSGQAVMCLDWDTPESDISDILYKQQFLALIAPHTRGYDTLSLKLGKYPWCQPIFET